MAVETGYTDHLMDNKSEHIATDHDTLPVKNKQVDVTNLDNINEDKSKNVTETQFDNWFQKGVKGLTNGPGFLGFLKRQNKEQENVFAKVDVNDDNKVSATEYNAGKDLLKDTFEDHVKQEFVQSEQETVQAELNSIDEQKYAALEQVAQEMNVSEIKPFQTEILSGFSDDKKLQAQAAISDPNRYALEYQERWNKEHGAL